MPLNKETKPLTKGALACHIIELLESHTIQSIMPQILDI